MTEACQIHEQERQVTGDIGAPDVAAELDAVEDLHPIAFEADVLRPQVTMALADPPVHRRRSSTGFSRR